MRYRSIRTVVLGGPWLMAHPILAHYFFFLHCLFSPASTPLLLVGARAASTVRGASTRRI